MNSISLRVPVHGRRRTQSLARGCLGILVATLLLEMCWRVESAPAPELRQWGQWRGPLANGAAPYAMPQKAMNVCAKAGMYKIDVGAAQPPQEKKKGPAPQ